MGELPQFEEVHDIVPPNFNEAVHEDAEVAEREQVLTLRPAEQGSQKLSVDTSRNPKETSKTPEGRSAIFRVHGLGFSPFYIFYLFLTSIPARFLVTFLVNQILSRLGE